MDDNIHGRNTMVTWLHFCIVFGTGYQTLVVDDGFLDSYQVSLKAVDQNQDQLSHCSVLKRRQTDLVWPNGVKDN